MPDSDIRVLEVEAYFSEEKGRVREVGESVLDEVTFCHVRARVENHLGQVSNGWGARTRSQATA